MTEHSDGTWPYCGFHLAATVAEVVQVDLKGWQAVADEVPASSLGLADQVAAARALYVLWDVDRCDMLDAIASGDVDTIRPLWAKYLSSRLPVEGVPNHPAPIAA